MDKMVTEYIININTNRKQKNEEIQDHVDHNQQFVLFYLKKNLSVLEEMQN